jgi:predicted NUDIX family NTP pyrophosphohydrolase
MAKTSAGLLMFRVRDGELQVLLVHHGGPFWRKKDDGAWFIAKGEVEAGEKPIDAARREFREETGFAPGEPLLPIGSVRQKSGKTIFGWAFAGDCDPALLKSNTFSLEWPPKSGRMTEFPEIDRAAFYSVEQARVKMHPVEFPFVERLVALLGARGVVR